VERNILPGWFGEDDVELDGALLTDVSAEPATGAPMDGGAPGIRCLTAPAVAHLHLHHAATLRPTLTPNAKKMTATPTTVCPMADAKPDISPRATCSSWSAAGTAGRQQGRSGAHRQRAPVPYLALSVRQVLQKMPHATEESALVPLLGGRQAGRQADRQAGRQTAEYSKSRRRSINSNL
jgi:hypothetical protein